MVTRGGISTMYQAPLGAADLETPGGARPESTIGEHPRVVPVEDRQRHHPVDRLVGVGTPKGSR